MRNNNTESTFTLSLAKYPGIEALNLKDPLKVSEIVATAMKRAENEVLYGTSKEKEDLSETVFGMTVAEVQKLFINVFFNHKLIIEAHHDPKEKELMSVLDKDNHPMAVFLGEAQTYTATGEKIERKKFSSYEDVKDFFQEYLYALRYCSMKDLADFLMIGEFDLVENLKMHNVQALITIQPALAYQKEHNIPVGKRVSGSGFFDVGDQFIDKDQICPVCQSKDTLRAYQDYHLCNSCKSGMKSI